MLSHKHYLQTKMVESAKHKNPKPKRSHVNFMQCEKSGQYFFSSYLNLEICSECKQNFQLFLLKQPHRLLSRTWGICGIGMLWDAYLWPGLPATDHAHDMWGNLGSSSYTSGSLQSLSLFPPTHTHTYTLGLKICFPSLWALHSSPYLFLALISGRSPELVLEKEARPLCPSAFLQVVSKHFHTQATWFHGSSSPNCHNRYNSL